MRVVIYTPGGQLILHSVRQALHDLSSEVAEARSRDAMSEIVRRTTPDLVVLQAATRIAPALAIARELRLAGNTSVPLLLIAADCGRDAMLQAMRAGVNDILCSTCSQSDVADAVARLLDGSRATMRPAAAGDADRLVGSSPSQCQVRDAIRRVAPTDTTVLITGETGTGKELVAEMIHRHSRRREHTFASINCAAIPEGLLESELFGYERGAFTGAQASREGKLQYAEGGTLFLDEIGDMNLYGQAKILRVIEARSLQRLGANRDIHVNIRVVAATNQNLEQLASQNRFRQDLYFRLNVARIHLAPLRERAGDIPELARFWVHELSARLGREAPLIADDLLAQLESYPWPGNVRELRNVLESALVFSSNNPLSTRDLPPYLRALFGNAERHRQTERERLAAALAAARGNRTEAARLLGCSRMTLYRWMVKHGTGEDEPPECNVLAGA
jgi:DNA-binding NtrC family response regulator